APIVHVYTFMISFAPAAASAHAIANPARERRRLRSAPSAAPARPTSPHAAICHGVYGPWPRTMFDVSIPSAPTENPASGPSEKPTTNVIAVIGLTAGSATHASRPSAATAASVATIAIIRADGRERSYEAQPTSRIRATIENAASGQLTAPPRAPARTPRGRRRVAS